MSSTVWGMFSSYRAFRQVRDYHTDTHIHTTELAVKGVVLTNIYTCSLGDGR